MNTPKIEADASRSVFALEQVESCVAGSDSLKIYNEIHALSRLDFPPSLDRNILGTNEFVRPFPLIDVQPGCRHKTDCTCVFRLPLFTSRNYVGGQTLQTRLPGLKFHVNDRVLLRQFNALNRDVAVVDVFDAGAFGSVLHLRPEQR